MDHIVDNRSHISSLDYSLFCPLVRYIVTNNTVQEISWQELQRALAPNVLSKLLQKRQAEEVATAGSFSLHFISLFLSLAFLLHISLSISPLLYFSLFYLLQPFSGSH